MLVSCDVQFSLYLLFSSICVTPAQPCNCCLTNFANSVSTRSQTRQWQAPTRYRCHCRKCCLTSQGSWRTELSNAKTLRIRPEKLPSELFPLNRVLRCPLRGKRSRHHGRGLDVANTRSYCKVVNRGGRSRGKKKKKCVH